MTLLVDIGNSCVKWCRPGALQEVGIAKHHGDWHTCYDLCFAKQKVDSRALASCVAGNAAKQALTEWLELNWDCEVVFAASERERDGLRNGYDNTEALGVDRWLGMLAAWQQRRRAFCLFDFGTAVTIDLVGPDGQHQGGWILGGKEMQLRSVAALPTVGAGCTVAGHDIAAGTDTWSALQAGVNLAMLATVRHLVDYCKSKHGDDIDFYFCGGDMPGPELVAAAEHCHRQPHLVLHGLAKIAAEEPVT